jgi:hypothetical protein
MGGSLCLIRAAPRSRRCFPAQRNPDAALALRGYGRGLASAAASAPYRNVRYWPDSSRCEAQIARRKPALRRPSVARCTSAARQVRTWPSAGGHERLLRGCETRKRGVGASGSFGEIREAGTGRHEARDDRCRAALPAPASQCAADGRPLYQSTSGAADRCHGGLRTRPIELQRASNALASSAEMTSHETVTHAARR